MNVHRRILFSSFGKTLATRRMHCSRVFLIRKVSCSFAQNRHIKTLTRSRQYELHKAGKRNKFTDSIREKIIDKLWGDKEMKAKVKIIQQVEELKVKKEVEEKVKPQLGDLIYGCTSSKHLLNFVGPWMDSEYMTLENLVRALEELERWFYQEIVDEFKDLPYGSVPYIYSNLKLLDDSNTLFQPVLDHSSFCAICDKLRTKISQLSKPQFVSSFYCLLHLGVPSTDSLMTEYYMRLICSDHAGYDINSVSELFFVGNFSGHIEAFKASYVYPKLTKSLHCEDNSQLEFKNFRAILTLLSKRVMAMKHEDLVRSFSMLYRFCTHTNFVDDLLSAAEILNVLTLVFNRTEYSDLFLAVFTELCDLHGHDVVQAMSELCMKTLEPRVTQLTPFMLDKLAFVPRRLRMTEFHRLLIQHVKYLFENKLDQLSMAELIWLTPFPRGIQPTTEIVSFLKNKFQSIDAPNLLLVFQKMDLYNLEIFRIIDSINKAILVHGQKICKDEYFIASSLMFNWAVRFKFSSDVKVGRLFGGEVELDFQRHLLDTYHNSCLGLEKNFRANMLMFLARCSQLLPESQQALVNFSGDETIYNVLSPGKLYVLLTSLTSMDNNIVGKNCEDELNKIIHFNIFSLGSRAFYRKTLETSLHLDLLLRTVNCLLTSQKMEVPLQTRVLDLMGSKPVLYLSDIIATYKLNHLVKLESSRDRNLKSFLNNLVSCLRDKEHYLSPRDWWSLIRFLELCCYKSEENSRFQEIVQQVLFENFSLERRILILLSHSCHIGVDLRKALKTVFSINYLSKLDELILEGLMKNVDGLLFRLNREACLQYPDLKIPWFQSKADIMKFNRKTIHSWKFMPSQLSYIIDQLTGGPKFVGKQFFLDYGVPVWRALILDQNNSPVKFTTRNIKLAEEMNYRKLSILYITRNATPSTIQKLFQWSVLSGFQVVTIHESEWTSLGHQCLEARTELIREKIFNSKPQSEVPYPPTVTCHSMSDQWTKYLMGKNT